MADLDDLKADLTAAILAAIQEAKASGDLPRGPLEVSARNDDLDYSLDTVVT